MNTKICITPGSFPQIPGYAITEQLYLTSCIAAYRAMQIETQRSVVIKVMRSECPSFSELVRFRSQYTITRNLSIPGIVRSLSLEPLGSSYVLVMEDWGGISLEKYIQQQSLDLVDVLSIALQIIDILHDLGQHRIIHKDIKPANILIHPESKQVKLIDFSIASLLPKETQEIKSPNILEGTLAYLAPEQTGRMNRGIDYRADFYTLGVTLYQLLTGVLPFISNDPLELIHCHIAKTAVPVNQVNPMMPAMVGEIVAKLMAKNAEDRYQSTIGLRHDVQHCLTQWQESREIPAFNLAQRDLSDRFMIPEKLYGREIAVQALLESFNRVAQGNSELMLVTGFSGIGKTAVVHEVHKPITQQNGYFTQGQFEQFNHNIPFSAFVQAFRGLIVQLLSESDTRLQRWKRKILEAVGDSGQVIIELIPDLEKLIGVQPPTPELSGTAAQNRFNLLFQKFTQVFRTPARPLVIFLDDLQWADSASLNLIQTLMTESMTGNLLLIGAYRDNEVSTTHPLMLTLDTVNKARVRVNRIELQRLNQNSINQLIADTLHCVETLANPLTELVLQKTQGNPFFATQFLKLLYQNKLITFDADMGCWQCDISQVWDAALTDDVVELMTLQLQKLPQLTQDILKLAACIGAQFDLKTLAIISEQSKSEVATALWEVLQAGLILPQSELYRFYLEEMEVDEALNSEQLNYKFLHDRVQQAAYGLIAEDQKQRTHLSIGRLLLQGASAGEREERLFEIVHHLNVGIDLITLPQEQEELAELNLLAGLKAKAATAYDAAIDYFTHGIELLPETAWESRYDLTLEMYTDMAESAYLSGNFEQMDQWIQIIQQQVKNPLDQVRIYEIKLQAFQAQGQQLKAIEIGREILHQLGISLPESISTEEIYQSVENTLFNCQAIPIDNLADLPLMTDPKALVILKMMISIVPSVHQAAPNLFPLIACEEVNLSLKYGNSSLSAPGYADFGIVVNTVLNKLEEGYQFGQLALSLVTQLDAKSVQSMTSLKVATFSQYNQQPIQASIRLLKESYIVGLETGDIIHAFTSTFFRLLYIFLSSGETLEALIEEIKVYQSDFAAIQHFLVWSSILEQKIENLITPTQQPDQLMGDYCDESTLLPILIEENDEFTLHVLFLSKLILSYLFARKSESLYYANRGEQYLKGAAGMFSVSVFYYYDSLARLAIYPTATPSQQEQILLKVDENQGYLKNRVQFAPMNFQHYYDLVEAELHRVLGLRAEALQDYDRAIASAKTNGFIQDEALANELAAKFYLDWGKEKIAADYMQEAYYGYAKWGAKAKTDDLETHYPDLLRPTLQCTASSINLFETLATIAAPDLSIHTSIHSSRSSSMNINEALDLSTILKASQRLSRTIQLDDLLDQLTQIILQYSGGDRCALLLPDTDGEWQVVSIATPESNKRCADPLDNNTEVPIKLIQYVKNTHELVVINNCKTDLPVIGNYLSQHQPKSALCLPILNQGKLIGMLYLGNRSTSGVFSSDRILILNFLCTQAAISLENARLYAAEQERSLQFQQSQQRLKRLIQQSPLAVMEWNTAFQITAWNPAAELIFGHTKAEALGQHFKFFIPEEFQSYVEQVAKAILNQQGGNQTINENIRKDGQRIICEWFNAPLIDRDNQVLGGVSMAMDITDRKLAEKRQRIQYVTTRRLANTESLEAAIPEVLQLICTSLDWNLGELWKLDPVTQTLNLDQTWHLQSDELTEFSTLSQASQFTQGVGLPGRVWAVEGPLWITDICEDEQFLRRAIARQCNLHTAVGFPIHNDQGLWGVLTLFTHATRPKDTKFLEMVDNIGRQIAQFSDRKTAELLIQQKNQALEQTLIQLQQSQAQIIQSEKMSALGNLVAGVAHEINNPIGFLNGSVNNARDYVQDLLSHLTLYQQHYSSPIPLIQDHAEDIDLEFLSQDLPKLLNSMKGATNRLKDISNSLRIFSRADTERQVSTNIHEGLDSTLLILKYRLKGNKFRPEIKIIQNYDEIPMIDCFPGQLNQVFMNILANAIDIFDEMAQQLSYEVLESNPQMITIQTILKDQNSVEIRIRDNGKGMSEDVKTRIFDHLFTTKCVGKGTGLGLAIAQQIIVEKHSGEITVHSMIDQGAEFIITLPISTAA